MWGRIRGCRTGVTPGVGGRVRGDEEDAGLRGKEAGGREGRSGEDRGNSGNRM